MCAVRTSGLGTVTIWRALASCHCLEGSAFGRGRLCSVFCVYQEWGSSPTYRGSSGPEQQMDHLPEQTVAV